LNELIRPFRWDVSRREQLGTLPDLELPELPENFFLELLRTCARVLAFAGDSDLVFLGRSPEPLFDFLSGALRDTSWSERLTLLNLALRDHRGAAARASRAIEPYFVELELDPTRLMHRPRPVALVDVVASGGSFEDLIVLLHRWCGRDGIEWSAVARKIRIVGLTWRRKTSPNTWRWQQQAEWARLLPRGAIKNVSVKGDVNSYLADNMPKVTASFPPTRWEVASIAEPLRTEAARAGLALARRLYLSGCDADGRRLFASELARTPGFREPWLRSLALEIKS
jgi:hypothetical protein